MTSTINQLGLARKARCHVDEGDGRVDL